MLSDKQYKAIRKAEYDAWRKGDDGDQHRRIAEYAYLAGQRAAFEEAAKEAQVYVDRIKGSGPKSTDARNVARIIHDRIEQRAWEVGGE